MIAFLALAAWADPPDVALTTTTQVRADATGQAFVSGRATAWGAYGVGPARLEAYGELGWPAGVDRPVVPELFVLAADGRAENLSWTLGRQRIDLPTFGRMLDGGHVAWDASETVRLEAWAGQARHVGLDGFLTGAPVARVAASISAGDLVTTAGVWGELGDAPAVHPDIRVRYQGGGEMAPDLHLLAAGGFGDGEATFERGRIELSARPGAGVRTLVYVEHREALAGDSQLGPGILESFAPDGVDQAGGGIGITTAKRAKWWVEGSAQVWDAERGAGLTGAVRYQPSCPAQSWCSVPSWRGAVGPGGVYQSFGNTFVVPMPDGLDLTVDALLIPYRKPYHDWDAAMVLRSTLEIQPGPTLPTVVVGGELARTALHPVDPRGWVALRWEAP